MQKGCVVENELEVQIKNTLTKLADDSYKDGVISGIKMCIEFTKEIAEREKNEPHKQTIMVVTSGLKDILVQAID